jgi:sugar lactone lactonase YvrE
MCQPVVLADAQSNLTAITALDGTNVCVIDHSYLSCGGKPPNTSLQRVTSSSGTPGGLALWSSNAYWAPQTGDAGRVLSAPEQPQAASIVLVPGTGAAQGIAVDATNVYWTDANGQVLAFPLDGGVVTELANAQSSPSGIAVDTTHVYWTNQVIGGSVMANALDAGPDAATVLAATMGVPNAIAVDTATVYWTDSKQGLVMRLAKP